MNPIVPPIRGTRPSNVPPLRIPVGNQMSHQVIANNPNEMPPARSQIPQSRNDSGLSQSYSSTHPGNLKGSSTSTTHRVASSTHPITGYSAFTPQMSPSEHDRDHVSSTTIKEVTFKRPNVPSSLLCPISGVLMKEPVYLPNGNVYDLESITKYVDTNGKDFFSEEPLRPGFQWKSHKWLHEACKTYKQQQSFKIEDRPDTRSLKASHSIEKLRYQLLHLSEMARSISTLLMKGGVAMEDVYENPVLKNFEETMVTIEDLTVKIRSSNEKADQHMVKIQDKLKRGKKIKTKKSDNTSTMPSSLGGGTPRVVGATSGVGGVPMNHSGHSISHSIMTQDEMIIMSGGLYPGVPVNLQYPMQMGSQGNPMQMGYAPGKITRKSQMSPRIPPNLGQMAPGSARLHQNMGQMQNPIATVVQMQNHKGQTAAQMQNTFSSQMQNPNWQNSQMQNSIQTGPKGGGVKGGGLFLPRKRNEGGTPSADSPRSIVKEHSTNAQMGTNADIVMHTGIPNNEPLAKRQRLLDKGPDEASRNTSRSGNAAVGKGAFSVGKGRGGAGKGLSAQQTTKAIGKSQKPTQNIREIRKQNAMIAEAAAAEAAKQAAQLEGGRNVGKLDKLNSQVLSESSQTSDDSSPAEDLSKHSLVLVPSRFNPHLGIPVDIPVTDLKFRISGLNAHVKLNGLYEFDEAFVGVATCSPFFRTPNGAVLFLQRFDESTMAPVLSMEHRVLEGDDSRWKDNSFQAMVSYHNDGYWMENVKEKWLKCDPSYFSISYANGKVFPWKWYPVKPVLRPSG